MATDEPHSPPRHPSLVERAMAVRVTVAPGNRGAAVAVALLLVAAPLATIAGARWLEARTLTEVAAVRSDPRLTANLRAERMRSALRTIVEQPGVGATTDALAAALPGDARLVSAARDTTTGAAAIEVATPDPDVLRVALRRHPATARYRDAGQRAGDAGLIVTLAEAAR